MKLKKWIAVVSALALSMTLLAGCGGNGGSAGGSDKGGTTTADGKKEVVIWYYFDTDSQKQMMKDLLDGFNTSQEEYTAKEVYVPFADYEKQLTLGMASGDLPDLVIMDSCGMASFIQLGLMADISDADIDWDAYIQGPMDSTMMDGKHYGIPFATNCTALFYNKDMFDKAGLNYPDENTTWDQFREMAKTLTSGEVYGFGNAAVNNDVGTFQCLQWLYTAGGSYTDIGGGMDAYKLMQEMIEEGSWIKESVNWNQSDVNNNFVAGNLAMQQNGPWQIPGIREESPDLNYGVTVLPKYDENSGQATSILGGENIGVVKKDNTDGAVAFLKYYDQDQVMIDAMKLYGSFPPKSAAAQDSFWMDDEIYAAFVKQLDTSIPRGPSAAWPSYSSVIQNGFQQVMTLEKTPEKAAADTQAAVDAVK